MTEQTEKGQDTNLGEWNDVKVFRDTVHQYIEIPKAYVHYLIDTYEMQRIKNVAQSGLRSVYNAATHDRFSHSMGVYHLGKKAFQSLKKNVENILNKEKFQMKSGEEKPLSKVFRPGFEITDELEIWEMLFHTACILHDIGHPAMSHTLEFLYDDIYTYTDIDAGQSGKENQPIRISFEEYKRYQELHEEYQVTTENPVKFKACLRKKLLDEESGEINGNPHERMSAYYILAGVEQEKGKGVCFTEGSLAENIERLINSFCRHIGKKEPISKKQVLEYLRFICRMIIGEPYRVPEDEERADERILNSIKNAVIGLLNGKIDADSLDYIARNSYSAGYDTNNVDVNRLCSAYSVRFQNNQFISVFEKNALSVLEGFVNARNFEPSWLYSHHKIVYNIDVLYKYMYKYAVKILYRNDLQEWSDIILQNFYGDGEPLNKEGKDESFYNKYIDKEGMDDAKIHTEQLSPDSINALANSLADIYVESGHSVLKELIQLNSNSSDERVAIGALCIQNAIRAESTVKFRSEEEWNKSIEHWVGGSRELLELREDIWDYVKTKWVFSNALIMIAGKKLEDIQESRLKRVMVQARNYLFKLADGDKTLWGEVENNKEDFFVFLNTLFQRYVELAGIEDLYFSYLLSPTRCFMNNKFLFYRSNDSDIDALFKNLYFTLKIKRGQEAGRLSKTEEQYYDLAQEYFERKYKSSLWKSYQEYKIFIDEVAENIKMDADDVSRCFLELIRSGGKEIGFQPERKSERNSGVEEQRVYKYNEGFETKTTGRNEFESIAKFQEVFSVLRDTDFVIRIHTIKYKDFSNSVKIAFKEKVFPLGDVIDLPDVHAREFPYIFLNLSDNNETTRGEEKRKYLEKLKKKLEGYCVETIQQKFITKKEDTGNIMASSGGKVFRDVVHGDIAIPKKFMFLIETKAFQRLRRIKQLSTADMVFPSAAHTRFAHCLGTFYVMTLIVEHFRNIFQSLRVPYEEEDVDALLAAALLHDIGHGPYSHNFERMKDNKKTHEDWSIEIIEKDTEMREALATGFPDYEIDDFISRIKSYIIEDKQNNNDKYLNFRTIFKSLMSSQLDADRLDYLLRDSYNTGIGYGKIDAYSIIRGMQITEYRNHFYVCITENAVSYIEQFLFGRYKMYDSVYYNAYKVFSEALVLKILEYVKINHEKAGISLDDTMKALLDNSSDKDLSLDEYLTLDDSYINGIFAGWQRSTDSILAGMCKALLQRKGYKRLYIMNQGADDLYYFKQEWEEICENYFPDIPIDMESLNSFIFTERRFTAYQYMPMDEIGGSKASQKIWVLTNDGLLKDFAEVSPMFASDNKKKWETYKSFVYYNRDMMNVELDAMIKTGAQIPEDFDKKKKMFLNDVEQLIKNSNLRNHIEIEEKYECRPAELDKVRRMLDLPGEEMRRDYEISPKKEIKQVDIYYDTKDMDIAKKKCSFRCRQKSDGSYKITIKAPTPNSGFDKESQVARFEYEKEIGSSNIEEALEFVRNTLKGVFPKIAGALTEDNINQIFQPQLTVKNNRSKYLISDPNADTQEGFRFTVCLDEVKFIHEEKERQDYQIEVELESDYIHRVSMKFFTEKIEECLEKPVRHEQYSKYVKGLVAFGLYYPEKE